MITVALNRTLRLSVGNSRRPRRNFIEADLIILDLAEIRVRQQFISFQGVPHACIETKFEKGTLMGALNMNKKTDANVAHVYLEIT
jgi:hypothetical protein